MNYISVRRITMDITLEWLKNNKACNPAIQVWQDYGLENLDVFDCIERLKTERDTIAENYNSENSLRWCIWLLPYCMSSKKNIVKYANHSAKLALSIFEKKYPGDNRPRKTIKLIDEWIKNTNAVPAEQLQKAAAAADAAAYAAADDDDAYAAADAAAAAAAAADDAYAAAYAAAAAAAYAAAAYAAAKTSLEIIDYIIDYGIKLLKQELVGDDNKENE